MKRQQILTEKCGECHGPYALGVKMGSLVFTTQIGTDITGEMVAGGVKEQTKATMENAKNVLEAAGASMDDIAKVTIYVLDMKVVPEMNEIYRTYFPKGNFPARCCTQCSGMVDGCLVEMEFTAVI